MRRGRDLLLFVWLFLSVSAAAVSAVWALGGSRPAAGAPPTAAGNNFTVYHAEATGSGVVASVTSVDTRSRAWASPSLDGEIYGEPLAAGGRVYVATENDTVYALAASDGAIVWARHVAAAVPSGTLPCGDITPEVGITGTPVIDLARGEVFVVADEERNGGPGHFLVGLSLASGAVEMTEAVDPPGADAAALLQRTGLTLDGGKVVFGFGGNAGDCSSYHGWVEAVPESGGHPSYFEVDAAPGDRQGAIWMGGAAPVVDVSRHVWVEAGNGSVTSPSSRYDDSDSVLELSPSLELLQYFAPTTWASDNASDLDMSTAPALLPDGDVVAAGKSRTAYLLDGRHLGGIGGQRDDLAGICAAAIDGGVAVDGDTVYLPCRSGIVAVRVRRAPPGLSLAWSSGFGGGPPIVAAGLVWTMGQNGSLYGLAAGTGAIRQETAVGVPANHFPTPGLGDGLLLAPAAYDVVAFAATTAHRGAGGTTTTTTGPSAPSTTRAAGPRRDDSGGGVPAGAVAGVVLAGLAVGAGATWAWSRLRRRPSGTG